MDRASRAESDALGAFDAPSSEHLRLSGGTGSGLMRIEDNHIRNNLVGKGAGINVSGRRARLRRSRGGRYVPVGWVLDALSSPAVDAGDPAADFSVESQPNGGRINLDAYANTAQASHSSPADPEHVLEDGIE